MDRNPKEPVSRLAVEVASREGGVDRNTDRRVFFNGTRSPPARGAWIATMSNHTHPTGASVASREGGVDRNSSSSPRAGSEH